MTDNTVLMQGKLEKCLDKLYDFSDFSTANYSFGVLSLRAFLALNIPTHKNFLTSEYSSKRINLEYKKLVKPKIEYFIYFRENFSLTVPKLVYDSLDIPVKD